MTDLEDDLRDALHSRGDTVTHGLLRYADAPRAPRQADRRRVLMPLATAAAVAVVAGGAAVAVVGDSRSDRVSTATGHRTRGGVLVGTRWVLVSVQYPTRSVSIPTGIAAYVEFGRDGRFAASDGMNDFSARYASTPTGVRIGDVSGTAAGYAGHDASQLAAISGIAAMQGSITTTVVGNSLTIVSRGPTPVFTRSRSSDIDPGFTGVSTGASASPTPTDTSAASPPSDVNGSEPPASPTAP